MGSDVMNEMYFFEKALKELNVSKFVYRGSFPKNKEQFNNSFKKIVGENSEQIAIESSNPSDFGVTWEQVNVKITELQNAEPLRLLREERNQKLVDSDWTQYRDVSLSNDSDWQTYRQSLRDLPQNFSPIIDIITEDGYPIVKEQTDWPEKPS